MKKINKLGKRNRAQKESSEFRRNDLFVKENKSNKSSSIGATLGKV